MVLAVERRTCVRSPWRSELPFSSGGQGYCPHSSGSTTSLISSRVRKRSPSPAALLEELRSCSGAASGPSGGGSDRGNLGSIDEPGSSRQLGRIDSAIPCHMLQAEWISMNWHDAALGLAGVIGSSVAVVHGVLTQRLMVGPFEQLADGRITAPIRRLVRCSCNSARSTGSSAELP